MANISINRVIAGATSDSVGYDGIMLSTPTYLNDREEAVVIIEQDKELYRYFSDYESAYKETLLIAFPIVIKEQTNSIVCRLKKEFTPFPKSNRFYERLEYYYTPCGEYSPLDIIKQLPEMVQYEKKNLGGLEQLQVKITDNFPAASYTAKAIFSNILSGNTVVLKTDNNDAAKIQEELINAIYPIPLIYQKYLGIGFNVKQTSSYYLNDKLHIYTSEDGGVSLQNLKTDDQEKNFVDAVFGGEIVYPDTEIQLLKRPINRDTLYKLLEYHKLHYQIDNDVILESEDIDGKILSYILTFVKKEFAQNDYIKKRIEAIILFLCGQKKLDIAFYEQLKQSFENQSFEFSKNAKITGYIADLYRNRDYSTEKSEVQYKALFDKNLYDCQKKDIVMRLGLNYLDSQYNFKELLKQNLILDIVVKLLDSENLETKLKWRNKYGEVKGKLKIEIQPTSDLADFQSICNELSDYSFDKDKTKDFVQRSIDLGGDRECKFYESAFKIAKEKNFQISLPDKGIVAKGEKLFNYYELFNANRDQIENANSVVDAVARKYISDELCTKEFKDILTFAEKETNQSFFKQYKPEIIRCVTEKYKRSNDPFEILKLLLDAERDLFLIHEKGQPENDFYKAIQEIKLNSSQLQELSRLSKDKRKQIDNRLIRSLIDHIIRNHKKQGANEESDKNKKRSFVRRWWCWCWCWHKASVVLNVVLAVALIAAFCQNCKNKISQTTVTEQIAVEEIVQPQPDNRDFLIDSLQNLSKLNPLPNDTLKNSRGYVGIATKNDSITKVVDKLIKDNQNDIARFYQFQKKDYIKYLIDANTDCFANQRDTCECDTLRVIPSYKIEKQIDYE